MAAAAAKKAPKTEAPATITLPALAKGEVYAGLITDKGKPAHHLVLLPGKTQGPWAECVEWAKKAGGELPTRREQSLLFANCKAEFEERWYWSGEQHASNDEYAWYQDFYDGYQYYGNVSGTYRARAVRRVPIQ